MTARTTYLTRTRIRSYFFFSSICLYACMCTRRGWAHQATMRVEEDQTDREFFILITPRRAITR